MVPWILQLVVGNYNIFSNMSIKNMLMVFTDHHILVITIYMIINIERCVKIYIVIISLEAPVYIQYCIFLLIYIRGYINYGVTVLNMQYFQRNMSCQLEYDRKTYY